MKEVGELEELDFKPGVTSSNFSTMKKKDKKNILSSSNTSVQPIETQSDFAKSKDLKSKRGQSKKDKVLFNKLATFNREAHYSN